MLANFIIMNNYMLFLFIFVCHSRQICYKKQKPAI
uniref:Uncharacterized protein n=1 Tax=Arundo donax TaxID=35708 RepID=A0A0A8ZWQ6_ARUDO